MWQQRQYHVYGCEKHHAAEGIASNGIVVGVKELDETGEEEENGRVQEEWHRFNGL